MVGRSSARLGVTHTQYPKHRSLNRRRHSSRLHAVFAAATSISRRGTSSLSENLVSGAVDSWMVVALTLDSAGLEAILDSSPVWGTYIYSLGSIYRRILDFIVLGSSWACSRHGRFMGLPR